MELTPEDLRKLQLLELKILVEIKRVCDKHNIEFILAYGTLLGAVRHKGFIPWDDDIDIAMTRDNFDKFCKIAPSELSSELFFQTSCTDIQCFEYCLARVRLNNTKFIARYEPQNLKHNGIHVDIFPLDNIPDSYCRSYFYYVIFNILIRVYILRNGYHPRPKSILARLVMYLGVVLCLPISTKKLKLILENYHKKYEKINGSYVIQLRSIWGFKRERHFRSSISRMVYMPFEGILMPVPEDYHIFLSEQYGDYMSPPPENLRKQHDVEIDFGIYR